MSLLKLNEQTLGEIAVLIADPSRALPWH